MVLVAAAGYQLVAAGAPALTLRVGVYDNAPVSGVPSGSARAHGLFVDLLEAIAVEEDWALTYRRTTAAAGHDLLRYNTVDLLIAVPREPEAQGIRFSREPIISTWPELYTAPHRRLKALSELGGRTIGMRHDDLHNGRVRELARRLNLTCTFVEFGSYHDILDAVQSEAVDIGVIDHLAAMAGGPSFGEVASPVLLDPLALCFAVAEAGPIDVLTTIDRHIDAMKRTPGSAFHHAFHRMLGDDLTPLTHTPSRGPSRLEIVAGAVAGIGVLVLLVLLRVDNIRKRRQLQARNEELERQTEREARIARDLASRESLYRGIYDQSPIGILLYDAHATLQEANQACLDILGATDVRQIRGISLADTLDPPSEARLPMSRGETVRYIMRLDHDKVRARGTYPTKHSGHRHLDVVMVPIQLTQEARGFLVQVQDITREREAEAERQRLFTAIEQSAETIVITNADGQIEYVNPAFEKASGYSRSEAVGQKPSLVRSDTHDRAFYSELWETLRKGEIWRGRFVNRRKDGNTYQDLATISPVKNAEGDTVNYVAVSRDITHELEIEERLSQAQKMEAIGTLAGGIAHDFNNILSSIIGYTQLAQQEVRDRAAPTEYLEQVRCAGNRAAELIKQILSFSRKSVHERGLLELGSLVKEALKLLRSSLPTTIEIVPHIARDCGPVLADATQIHQVVMNLCTNAAQAIDSHGTITVSLRETDSSQLAKAGWRAASRGRYAELSVADTGSGMSENTLQRVFEPYFTTKQVDKGTGLGLSVVHNIVDAHDGFISVDSTVGRGTKFTVWLPVTDREAEASGAEVSARTAMIPHGTERIMFVDDEEMIAFLARNTLEGLDYHVRAFTDSREALLAFREAPDHVDLLITDQTMPGLTGTDLAREVHALRSDVPVVLCSGYSHDMSLAQLQDVGVTEFVMKPIERSTLAQVVRKVLDGEVTHPTTDPAA